MAGREIDDIGRWMSPGILGRRMRLDVTRPRDHLVLVVTAADCDVAVGDDDVPRLVPAEGASQPRLIVSLPPQHVFEQVFVEKQGNTAPPGQQGRPEQPFFPVGARFAGASRLAFTLSPGDSVELSTAGILDAMSRLTLAVAPLAEANFVWRLLGGGVREIGDLGVEVLLQPGVRAAQASNDRVRATRLLTRAQTVGVSLEDRVRIVDLLRPGGGGSGPADRLRPGVDDILVRPFPIPIAVRAEPRPPTSSETALEVPSRLVLSPSERGAWAHRRDVDNAPGSVVELWSTRLGVRSGNAKAPAVDEQSTEQRIVRAVWTRDLDRGRQNPPNPTFPFRSSLLPNHRISIVDLTTGNPGTAWRIPPPPPIDVNKMSLTALGAFIDVRGVWDEKAIALTEWQHRTTLGRDQFVKVVEKGYLFPFGHRAVHVTEARRKVDPALPDSDFAILWQRHYIILKEHTRSYNRRDMSFVQVTIDPTTTPDINDPGTDTTAPFWPTIGSQAFAFKITASDQDGTVHHYDAPLLFVPVRNAAGLPAAPTVYGMYALDPTGRHHVGATQYESLVRHDLGGKRVAVAPKGAKGEATYETRVLRFTATADADTSTPSLLFGELVVPAVAATTGKKTPLSLSYAQAYIDHGFEAAGNAGEVVLVNAEGAGAPTLKFDSSDRSGGFLNPSQHIAGIARGTGPVSNVAAAAAGTPTNPSSLFSGLGKILGLFELSDVLDALGLDDLPAYAAQVLDVVGSITNGVDRAVDLLNKAGGAAAAAAAQLDAASNALDALLAQNPPPGPADFAAFIATTLSPAVDAARAAGVVDTLAKAEAAIVTRVLDTVNTVLHPPGLPFDPASLLADLAAGKPIAQALTHVHLEWSPPVKQWPGGSKDNAIFLPKNDRPLLLAVDVRGGDLAAAPSAEVLAQFTDFTLQLVPGMPLIHIPFNRLYFRATTGAKTEIDVDLGPLEWLGVLGFVDKLRQLIPMDGFSDPPSVTVDASGIGAGFTLVLPNVAVGVFNLSNLSMAADIKLPFLGDAPSVGFSFCSRERPFTLAVLFLGGGGFFGLRLSPKKLVLLEAAIEFGATLALDFGVASGSVSVMAGVYLRLEADDGSLTGYLRIRGEVDVLGLISASIEMYMSLTYEFGSGKVIGKATITVEIEILMFSASVSISAERRFAGSKGDPTFADALGPYVDDDCAWITYCQAFAEV